VWTHTLLVMDEAVRQCDGLGRAHRVTVMLGALCHDLGKPATTAVIDGRIRSPGHEESGVAPTLSLLDRLNVHSIDGYDVRGQVAALVAQHLKPGQFHKAPSVSDGAFRRLAQKVDCELLARVARADCNGRTGAFDCSAMDWFIERARAIGVERKPPEPLLLGRHVLALGLTPGPRVGEVLKQVYERQLDGEITSVDQAIAAAEQMLAL
jgi:tRNA nucleotidyltransferase (CCA-adding enzyme)